MSIEKISEIIQRLNETKFKNILTITNEENYWHIDCTMGDVCYFERQCWLDSPRKFEMRHGGGSDFAWWVDTSITNEVALQFNGIQRDEGGGEPFGPVENYYPRFVDFLHMMHPTKNKWLRLLVFQTNNIFTPPPFRIKFTKLLRLVGDRYVYEAAQ